MKERVSLTVPVTDEDRATWSIQGLRGEVIFATGIARAAGFLNPDCVTASIEPEGRLFHFEVSEMTDDAYLRNSGPSLTEEER